ncbi:hypothetical protein BJP36_37095 [Moorena producens JHB]|uniref:Uncharacterized protein n=1 Tax=Moorena producens (strain JHB) TaxID=1454205 RepID=A0A9Q9UWA5_MOOP1|nr:hypothetical protein [Moorena producens]WAN69710.1 hypothetical protein BJP36_37095 [Moorena producens JHB]
MDKPEFVKQLQIIFRFPTPDSRLPILWSNQMKSAVITDSLNLAITSLNA